jgi:3-hydroxyacyl-[acyl-carrier-protein] dehydratase
MAQIGLVCLGLQLTNDLPQKETFPFALSSAEIAFLKPVYPDETVTVYSEKIYFRFGKLKCKVNMKNANGELVCEGTIAGILIK